MATKPTPEQPQPEPVPAATPSAGGSYIVDEKTGQHTLVERTQENTKE